MSGNTEEAARFKKTEQVVGGGENNNTVPNYNEQAMKNAFAGTEQNQTQEPRPANSAIERDLQEQGYTTRQSDEALDEYKEMEKKLENRAGANAN
ncbi:uncharacterized protein FA14DRAFT_171183 [Meira miltonrushii]|uniref:Uncharacterized protein n=1 Tax=Meira miltonrushii TaxID=1280837 RepID=A0A316VLV7_9BASI|nr:uncharacterized protein FA14DRAFT_171183 [Meira miltonrushii]PWN38507.1 hypothetical protein FA14DRAFT_171183 [Meira miltonrushii]